MMDLTESIEPRSDQLNADSFIGGPATYTIREVIKGAAEHPFDFLLVETDRAYRPSKTMRRVIVNAWGAEAANYAGRRLTLYREPTIKYGGVEVGGIRISHMSHIEGPVEVMAQTTRGKREKFTVQPLPATAAQATAEAAPEAGKPSGDGPADPLDATPATPGAVVESPPASGQSVASGGEGRTMTQQIREMTVTDLTELRARIGVAPGVKGSEVARIIGDWSSDIEALLVVLRENDCTFAEAQERGIA